jgi:hypothetical protein
MSCATTTENTPLVNPEIARTWRNLLAAEVAAPPGLRGGLARARTALLDSIPPWQLPAVMDSLARMDEI